MSRAQPTCVRTIPAPWRFGSDVVEHASHPDLLYRYQRMALGLLECDVIAPDEVAIIEVLHRRMLQERRYYAQSQAGLRR